MSSQLRGDGGISSQALHSEGTGSRADCAGVEVKRFCLAGRRGRVKKMEQALCSVTGGVKEKRRGYYLIASPTFLDAYSFSKITASCILLLLFSSIPSFHKTLQGFSLSLPFPQHAHLAFARIPSTGVRYYILANKFSFTDIWIAASLQAGHIYE